MFRFQLLCRNVNLLKQVRCWPLEGQTVGAQFFRGIANENIQDDRDSKTTSKTDIATLRQLVKEQVGLHSKNLRMRQIELKSPIFNLREIL